MQVDTAEYETYIHLELVSWETWLMGEICILLPALESATRHTWKSDRPSFSSSSHKKKETEDFYLFDEFYSLPLSKHQVGFSQSGLLSF